VQDTIPHRHRRIIRGTGTGTSARG
jgi:hypothetical protein